MPPIGEGNRPIRVKQRKRTRPARSRSVSLVPGLGAAVRAPRAKRRKPKPRFVPPRAPDRAPGQPTTREIERYKQSPAYLRALRDARRARLDQNPKLRPKDKSIYGLFGLRRYGAEDALRAIDFHAINRAGLDRPRTDAEMRTFLRTGQKVRRGRGVLDDLTERSAKRAETLAPVLKLADYTLRPTYAGAGAVSAALRGKSVKEIGEAAGRGVTGKERKTFSTVLKEQGVHGPAASIGGFALDVIADPTSWVSFGASSAVRKAAVKAGQDALKQAEKAARRQGVTRTQARLRGIQARDKARAQALKEAGLKAPRSRHETGLQIRLGGKAVPGVERATGAVRHGVRRAGGGAARALPRPLGETADKARAVLREGAADVNANVRRTDPLTRRTQSKASQVSEKTLRRETRAEQQKITRDLHEKLNAMRGFVSKDEMPQIIDAIEAGNLKPLRGAAPKRTRRLRGRRFAKDPERLVLAARNIEADLKYLNRVGRRSGAISGRIGPKGRTLQEIRQADVGPARSTKPVQDALKQARSDQAQARIAVRNLPADAKPSVRQAARRKVRHTQDRVEFLRKRLHSLQTRQIDVQSARNVRSVGRTRRLSTEARGYFPRVTKEETRTGGALDRILALRAGSDVPYATVGSNRPNIAPGQRREHRQSRAELRQSKKTEHIPEALSDDVRDAMSQYAASVARGASASNLNTKLIQQLGRKLPPNPSMAQLADLSKRGWGVYRVRRGVLEELHPERNYGLILNASGRKQPLGLKVPLDPKTGKPIRPQETGGQVMLLNKAQLARVRAPEAQSKKVITQLVDAPTRAFKTLALSTPGYLVRNFVGDSYNAWSDEKFWRIARNQARSAKVLRDTHRQEKAMRDFDRTVRPKQKTVKLTDEQAAQIARELTPKAERGAKTRGPSAEPVQVSRTMKASAVARLAEQLGVIRQGRFVELMEDYSKKPRGSNAWKDISKRVEDQTRLATFMGGLQRGMNPREAAHRASQIHFDYGDLSDVERNVFRRIAPFYTFPARNIPLQAKSFARRPQKFGTIAKAAEEGQRAVGLKDDYREGQAPYEQRQLGIPIKVGDKTYTVSLGLPFTDLNDVIDVASGVVSGALGAVGVDVGGEGFTGAGNAAAQRVMEATGPIKTIPELMSNHSFFYRDEISPEKEPFTRAPEWAIKASKASPLVRKKLGLVDDYLPPDAPGKVWGWPRKMDYAFRQGQPGAINPLLDVLGQGVKGANARQMTRAQRTLAFFGLRAIRYESDPAKLNALYDRRERVQSELDKLGRRSGADPTLRGTSSNATRTGKRLLEELSAVEEQIDALQVKERTKVGGLVKGERVSKRPKSSGLGLGPGRVNLGSGSTGVGLGPGRVDLR